MPSDSTNQEKEVEPSEVTQISFRISSELKRQFHAKCIVTDTNMNEVLLAYIKSFVGSKGILSLILGLLLFSSLPATAQLDELLQAAAPQPIAVDSSPQVQPQVNVPARPSAAVPTDSNPQVKKPVKVHKPTTKLKPANGLDEASRTISNAELANLMRDKNVEIVVTNKTKEVNVSLGETKATLEVPIMAYLIKDKGPVTMPVPMASPDSGYKYSDGDMRDLKILYNTLLSTANSNPTTAKRFQNVLKDLEDYIHNVDDRKSELSATEINPH